MDTKEYETRLLQVHSGSIVCIEEYFNAKTYIRHICDKDHVFKNSPDHLLRGRGCTKCGNIARSKPRTHEKYIELVASINKNILVVGDYINSSTKILHKCRTCTYEWNVLPPSILIGLGCPACAIEKRNKSSSFYTFEEYIFGSTVFKIQGNERFALDKLKQQGYKSKDIVIGAGQTPTIKYPYKGSNKIHFPDIYIKKENRIIEVKSLYTFIGVSSDKIKTELFNKNKAKYKQAILENYLYEFWLFDRYGNELQLPTNWHCLNRRLVEKALTKGTLK